MSKILELKNHPKEPSQENKPIAEHTDASEQKQLSVGFPPDISWNALEYPYYQKTPDWYWAIGIISIAFFAVALILGNILFAGLVLLGGFTVALYGARKPKTILFSLSAEGIHVAQSVYPYESLESFWIFYNPPHTKELRIESQKLIMPIITIPLGDVDPVHVRSFLKQFLPEEHQEESLFDSLARYIHF